MNARKSTRYRIDPDLTKEQMAQIERKYEEARIRTKQTKNGSRYVVIGKENPVLRRFTGKEVQEHQHYLEVHRKKGREMRRSEDAPGPT